MIQTSNEVDKLHLAYVNAQSEFTPVIKNGFNPHFKNKFADIGSIKAATDPALHKHGLAIVQNVSAGDGGVNITTRIMHVSGQWLETDPAFFPASKQDAQGMGSATTYGRRYQLAALLSISAEEDDDGNAASKPGKKSAAATAASVKAKGKTDDEFL